MIFEGEYDQEKMVIFDKTDIGLDAIPFQYFEYPHNTWLWVGLNWKFMHLIMGSLWTHIIGVMPRLPPLLRNDVNGGEL